MFHKESDGNTFVRDASPGHRDVFVGALSIAVGEGDVYVHRGLPVVEGKGGVQLF